MKSEYIVSNEYLAQRGLDLNEYALDGTYIDAIIQTGLDIAITRCCFLNDAFLGEDSVELALDEKPQLVKSFLKLQHRIIYNLIFQNETSPVDSYIDSIIAHELGWGKINGFQKGTFYRNDR